MHSPTLQPPRDYEQDDQATTLDEAAGDISYAALLDRFEAEQPITDAMIRQACVSMETAQQFPFSGPEEEAATAAHGSHVLDNTPLARWWRSVF